MATATSKRWRRVFGAIAVAGLLTSLAACSSQDVNGQSDEVTCVYDHETGQLVGEPMMPGSAQRTADSDDKVVKIPTSDRFWDISSTSSRDAAAPEYLVAHDASYKETHTVIQVRFRFNAALACKWYDQHGRRDAVETGGDPQFNINGNPNTPWQKWLNRNFTGLEDTINQDLVSKYNWEYLEFNFPVNADKNGVLPYLPDENPEDGIPPGKVEPGLQTLRQIEIDFGKALSDQLTKALGDQYFCGIDYSPGGACTPLLVNIKQITLADQTPVTNRKALIDQAEANATALEKAELTRAGTEAAVAAQQATVSQQAQIDQINADAAIAKAANDKAVADAQAALKLAQGQDDIAPCLALGTTSASECAELLVAIANGTLRPAAGGTVNINPTPGG